MGKKLQGAALRAKKRQKALVEELQEAHADQVAKQSVVEQTDEQLFTLDTTGDSSKATKLLLSSLNNKKKKKKGTTWSTQEQKAIERLVKQHSKEQLATMAHNGKKLFDKYQHVRTRGIRKSKTVDSVKTFDMWGEKRQEDNKEEEEKAVGSVAEDAKAGNETDSSEDKKEQQQQEKEEVKATFVVEEPLSNNKKKSQVRKGAKGVSVALAKSGQSYRPDPQEHYKVLKEAVAVEERRQEAETEKNAPISRGMTETTKALLLGDSDTSDDEEEEDEENNEQEDDEATTATASSSVFHKKREKLTRAQRNKQKRLRQEERTRRESKRRRIEENAVFSLTRFQKELSQEQVSHEQRQAQKRALAEERAAHDPAARDVEQTLSKQDPLMAPTFPVALPREVGTGKKNSTTSSSSVGRHCLRTMIPKGDLVTDRMASYALRSLTPSLPWTAAARRAEKQRRKQRPTKKVKGGHEWVGTDFVIIK